MAPVVFFVFALHTLIDFLFAYQTLIALFAIQTFYFPFSLTKSTIQFFFSFFYSFFT
jgi:hypothetical protein